MGVVRQGLGALLVGLGIFLILAAVWPDEADATALFYCVAICFNVWVIRFLRQREC